MITQYKIGLFLFLLFLSGCIVQFIPETGEIQELLVVEGLITDQPGVNTIKLSKSLPVGAKNEAKPLTGCVVSITDDGGGSHYLTETVNGNYVTDPLHFQGVVGRKYSLHINVYDGLNEHNYESLPMELKPVPPIDSVYYEKVRIREKDEFIPAADGCQIYLNTHDPANFCKFYRWEYSETWEFRLPYPVTNRICWLFSNSERINIKNTSVLGQDRIERYPLVFVSNNTDRLSTKYSILVNQYSLNEDEYNYWEKLKNISQDVGSLYDVTPAAIPSNIYCQENPSEKVLGYFSVSAVSSKRVFVKDVFRDIVNLYKECISDTIYGGAPIPGLDVSVWLLEAAMDAEPPFRTITEYKGCADCTVRGTKVMPSYWMEDIK